MTLLITTDGHHVKEDVKEVVCITGQLKARSYLNTECNHSQGGTGKQQQTSAGLLLHSIYKVMTIFDQNLSNNEALTKPNQFMINSQISFFGISTGPQKGDRKWRNPVQSVKSSRTNCGLEICFEVSRTLFALLNNL